VVASATDTKHLNHTFILHSEFNIQIILFQTIVMLKVDYTQRNPNIKIAEMEGSLLLQLGDYVLCESI
jgi:hypothetical protein